MTTQTPNPKRTLSAVSILLLFSMCANAQMLRNSENITPSGKGWGAVNEVDTPDDESFSTQAVVRTTKSNGMVYHGGPVMPGRVNVYFIWYGDWTGGPKASDSQMTVSLLESAFGRSGIGVTGYSQIAATYSDKRTVAAGSFALAQSTSDYYSRGKSLTDAAVTAVVSNAIQSGRLPKDSNGIYFVLSSSDVNETSGFCKKYCGFHNHARLQNLDIKYAFVGNADRCSASCEPQSDSPNDNASADAMVSTMAHETMETITDPDMNAWYDSQGQEVGDKCSWMYGPVKGTLGRGAYNLTTSGHNWLVQMAWANANGGGCALSKGGKFYNQ